MKFGVAWAKEGPISGSESLGGSTNVGSLMLTLRDWPGQRSACPPSSIHYTIQQKK